MLNTTLKDLVLSAQAAANKAFEAKNSLERMTIKTEEFGIAGFDPADFDHWEQAFGSQLEMLNNFSKQPSPATLAARKAAPAAPAK